MTTKIVGFGAWGHAKVLLDILTFYPEYEVLGLVDPKRTGHVRVGKDEYPILGNRDVLQSLIEEQGVRTAFVAVGSIRAGKGRSEGYLALKELGFEMPWLKHPSAVVSKSAVIGEACVMMANSYVGVDTVLGNNVVINSGAIVEHDSTVDDHAHLSPGVTLAGGVHVGASAHVGVGARILQNVKIGPFATVGAGAVVIEDVPEGTTVVGVPARPIS